jgi:surface antigen/uncharacterized protein YukE
MAQIYADPERMKIFSDLYIQKANRLKDSQSKTLSAAQGIAQNFTGTAISGVFATAVDGIKRNHNSMYDVLNSHADFLNGAALTYEATDEALGNAILALTGGVAVAISGGRSITLDNPSGFPSVIVGQQIPRDSDYYSNTRGGNPFARGQCTWYAWGRIKELTKKSVEFSKNVDRHAKNWPTLALNAIPKAIPEKGYAMIDTTGKYGHVAVVERVELLENGDYRIIYSEANWDSEVNVENPATDGIVKEILLSKMGTLGFDTFLEII